MKSDYYNKRSIFNFNFYLNCTLVFLDFGRSESKMYKKKKKNQEEKSRSIFYVVILLSNTTIFGDPIRLSLIFVKQKKKNAEKLCTTNENKFPHELERIALCVRVACLCLFFSQENIDFSRFSNKIIARNRIKIDKHFAIVIRARVF